jgi:hypothetical protein
VVSCCEHGNEPSGSIKDGQFIDQRSNCQLLNKGPISWSQLCNTNFVLDSQFIQFVRLQSAPKCV